MVSITTVLCDYMHNKQVPKQCVHGIRNDLLPAILSLNKVQPIVVCHAIPILEHKKGANNCPDCLYSIEGSGKSKDGHLRAEST